VHRQERPVERFALGQFIFDPQNLVLIINKDQTPLTQMESDILKILCENTNEVTKRSVILNRIWGDDDYFNGRSLDVFISRLRKLLAPDPNISIENQHGVGFRLKVTN
jgi:DNA-binding response OmpR family regulator